MKRLLLAFFLFISLNLQAQIVAPDTVCVGTPVNFTTLDTATTYAWDFASISVNQPISATALFNTPGGAPAFSCFNNDGGNYYYFYTDYYSLDVFRLSYGTSIYSTPTVTNLGTLGVTSSEMEGIDIVKDEAGNWWGLVVADNQMAVLNFGASLSNTPTSTVTVYSQLLWPHQVTIKQYGGSWHAFVGNRNGGIVRFDFGASLAGVPVVTSIPNVGGAYSPCNFTLYEQAGSWYMLMTDLLMNGLTLYSFGTNLLNNAPTGTAIPVPAGDFNLPRPVNLLNDCQGNLIGYVVNETGEITKLDFAGNITNTPTFTSLGASGVVNVNAASPCAYSDSFAFILVDYSGVIYKYHPLNLVPASYLNYYTASQSYTFASAGTYNISLFLDMGYTSGPSVFCRAEHAVVCSTPCLTNSLIINTGYDPITNAAVTPSTNGGTPAPDPHWILSAVSPGVATAIAATPIPGLIEVVPGNNADVVQTLTGSWATNPVADPGGWISCLNSNTYNDCLCGTPYNMTLGRPFRMCSDDSIKLSFYIANDNYISASDLDGTPLGFTETTPPLGTYFSTYTYFTKTVYLTAGTHTVHFEVNNWNITSGSPANPTGLDIYGTVASATGSNTLVSESSAACNTYVCGGSCPTLTMPDTVKLCLHDTATLHPVLSGGDSILSITWSPATGLSSTTILSPVVTATTSGWYDLTVQSLLPDNLVDNGNFQFGNVGFTSSYIYSPPPSTILNEGYYSVYNNPNGVHSGFLSMGSYPVTGGNMLIINGGTTASSVWCETIAVTPNTNYDFSAWFADCSAVTTGIYVPVLQFMVNGVLLGTPTPVSAAPGTWMNFFATWNSGTNTTANICIYDETTAAEGNDFVIDDISFEPICKVTDSVYVKVNPVDTSYSHTDTSVCNLTSTVTLNAPAGYTNYRWNTGVIGVSSITGAVGGTYWVEDTGICILRVDTFHINAIVPDTTLTTNLESLCQGTTLTLTAPAGYVSLTWSTGSTAASITVTDTGTYVARESFACGTAYQEYPVTYKPPVIAAAKDTVKGCFYLVDFMGSPAGSIYSYLWTGPAGFTSTMQNPVIQSGGPANEGVYTLTVTNNTTGCNGKANTTVVIVPIPPVPLTNVSGTQTINYGSSVQLNADNALYYWWLPDDGTISNRNINDPFVNPTVTTVYTVYGMDSLGCVDSAKVTVDVINDSIYVPSAFTPNNDGLNDVFRPMGMKYQSLVEFSVYNRWGQRVFSTSNKDQGWDGTFNGVKQDMDVYNYVLIVALNDGATRMFKGNVTLVR